jgi:hypothetical protein
MPRKTDVAIVRSLKSIWRKRALGAFGKIPECPKISFFLTCGCLKRVFEIQTVV